MRKIPVELTKRYQEEGWWTDETLGDLVAGGLRANPDTGFVVHSAVRPFAGTFRDVELEARRLAAGLHARGVGPGDVIALQLPNWMEAAAAFWASTFLGAVTVPIVHFYGRKELTHILGTAKPRVFITAEEFGRMKFQPDLCEDIPIVGLVGQNYDELLAAEPLEGTLRTDPASPALIAFTSGTTSNPKGVVHSHQTLGFETRQLLENYPDDRGRQLTATPVGHFIGMLGAFLIPVLEVEEVLLTMPSVVEAVVVAVPDARLGERAAAVLRVRDGHGMPTVDEVRDHFKRAGVAAQKWPEELHQVDDFPRTASGKVQKFLVRRDIATCRK